MAAQKQKLLHLAKLFWEETDEEHPVTVPQMIDYLARLDIRAERKSIYDDLALLQQFGLDIVYRKSKAHEYFLASRSFDLPELKLLIDVVQSSPILTESKSMELIAKLERLTSRHNAGKLQRQVYVLGQVKGGNPRLYYSADAISQAIHENRKVRFRYFDWTVEGGRKYRKNGAPYTVNPVALCVDKHYYLTAYDAGKGDYRNYRVDRMTDLEVLPQTSRDPIPPDSDLPQHIRQSFDMYQGQATPVTLRFHNSLINAAMDRFGQDAFMHPSGPETFDLSATVDLSPTFFSWLLCFGSKAQILQPELARQQFCHLAQEALSQYKNR